jgi:hypothetical protein
MRNVPRLVVFALISTLVGRAASAEDRFAQTRPGEALLGPFPIEETVQGVPVSMRAYAFLAVKSAADPIELSARVVADLSDFQRKVSSLIDTIPLPTDNCAHFGIDNLVARIWGKQITIDDDVATLKLNGDVDVWTCAKNPIPCTKLEGWSLVFYDCNPPMKNRNINQPFEAAIPFRLAVVDQHTVELRLGEPVVNLGGTLGGVTDGILKIAGVDINGRAKQAIEGAIRPDLLKKTLPAELLSFNPVITKAELLSNSGALAASLEMSVSIDSKTLEGLGTILGGNSESTK